MCMGVSDLLHELGMNTSSLTFHISACGVQYDLIGQPVLEFNIDNGSRSLTGPFSGGLHGAILPLHATLSQSLVVSELAFTKLSVTNILSAPNA